jgi:hypothetical protein
MPLIRGLILRAFSLCKLADRALAKLGLELAA